MVNYLIEYDSDVSLVKRYARRFSVNVFV